MKWVGSDLCKQGVESRFARKDAEKASRGLDASRGKRPREGFASRGKRPREGFASRGGLLEGSILKPGEHILIHKNHVSPWISLLCHDYKDSTYCWLYFFWICLSSKSFMECIILLKQPFRLLRILQCFLSILLANSCVRIMFQNRVYICLRSDLLEYLHNASGSETE